MESNSNLFLVSSSYYNQGTLLDHCKNQLNNFLAGTSEILFIPFAQANGWSFDEYTADTAEKFKQINDSLKLTGIHQYENMEAAIRNSEAIFVGGGNTFLLLAEMQEQNLLTPLKEVVEKQHVKYIGSSAGSNLAGINIKTTNDMPIKFPQKGFDALRFTELNINPHYPKEGYSLDENHMGESRRHRIEEFLVFNDIRVIALREDQFLIQSGGELILHGKSMAKLFGRGHEPVDIPVGQDLNLL